MKKRLIKENFEKRLNDSLRKKPFRTLHDLLCELYSSYNSCLAGNLSGDPNDYQERFVRLCQTNNLDFETEWDKMEHRHDN